MVKLVLLQWQHGRLMRRRGAAYAAPKCELEPRDNFYLFRRSPGDPLPQSFACHATSGTDHACAHPRKDDREKLRESPNSDLPLSVLGPRVAPDFKGFSRKALGTLAARFGGLGGAPLVSQGGSLLRLLHTCVCCSYRFRMNADWRGCVQLGRAISS